MLKDLEDGPPFLCPKCGRTYSHKCNLTRHLRLECGVGPRFQCAWCKKRFKHRHHLRDHQRIHLYSNCTFELRNWNSTLPISIRLLVFFFFFYISRDSLIIRLFIYLFICIGLAIKWLRILPLGDINKVRNHLVANPIYRLFICFVYKIVHSFVRLFVSLKETYRCNIFIRIVWDIFPRCNMYKLPKCNIFSLKIYFLVF